MKKLLLLLPVFLTFSFTTAKDALPKKERKFAADLLKDTKKGVFAAVKGLSEAQLKFKPSADSWSVEECLKHIAVTEKGLWSLADATLKQAANPEKRSDIKWTDEDVVKNIASREQKVKTMDPMKPENTPYKSAEEALDDFKENRKKVIDYVKNTEEDLRNHVGTLPFGNLDAYQIILMIGAHSDRHRKQIEEVKADPNFPKS